MLFFIAPSLTIKNLVFGRIFSTRGKHQRNTLYQIFNTMMWLKIANNRPLYNHSHLYHDEFRSSLIAAESFICLNISIGPIWYDKNFVPISSLCIKMSLMPCATAITAFAFLATKISK